MHRFNKFLILFFLLGLQSGFTQKLPPAPSLIEEEWVNIEHDTKKVIHLDSWMQELSPYIKDKYIKDLFIPGAHDAATSQIAANSTIIGDDMPTALNHLKKIVVGFGVNKIISLWAKAQDLSIYNLLQIGVRYLDIRVAPRDRSLSPFSKKIEYWTFHSLSGEPFMNVLLDIRNFLNDPYHQNEIIILDLQNVVGGVNDEIYYMITRTLGTERLGNADTLKEKTLHEIWETKERIFILNGSKDLRSPPNMNSLIITRSKALESFWPNASSAHEFKEKMLDYYNNKWDPATKKSVLVVQGQLTPDNNTLKNGFNFTNKTAARSLKELWQNWRPNFIKYLPYFFKITQGSVIMTDFIDSSLTERIIQENIP